jgi:stage II sporulation protein D
MSPLSRRVLRTAVAAGAVAAGTIASLTLAGPAAHAETVTLGANDKIVVTLRGNGHGHGLSQYGARGAAIKGLSYASIVRFYYPGTTLTTLPRSMIRVQLGNTGTTTTVAAQSGMTVTGVSGALPTTGVSRYRLVADAGKGIALQQLRSATGSVWRSYKNGLPNGAAFYRSRAITRVFDGSGGASTSYWGYLGAVRVKASGTAGGVYTVNRTSLDNYTAGVVPREMPASWQQQAVLAQAVAARTYGRYSVEHPQSSRYDLCASSSCQVYGGAQRLDARGRVVWTEYATARTATSNKVLRYKGATIFAQFSASHGGWSSAGGQPYLVAKQDIYDTAASADPYLNYTRTMTAKSLASQFGMATLTRLAITKRDGAGPWGGRVLAATVTGRTAAGKAKQLAITGYDLQSAFDAGTALFTVRRG